MSAVPEHPLSALISLGIIYFCGRWVITDPTLYRHLVVVACVRLVLSVARVLFKACRPYSFWILRRLRLRTIHALNRAEDSLRLLRCFGQQNVAGELPAEILTNVFGHIKSQSSHSGIARTVLKREGLHTTESQDNSHRSYTGRPLFIQDLHACALVCRSWSTCALGQLYKHLALNSVPKADSVLLQRSDSILKRVIRLSLPNYWDGGAQISRQQTPDIRASLDILQRAMLRLQTLQAIELWVTQQPDSLELQLAVLDDVFPKEAQELVLYGHTAARNHEGAQSPLNALATDLAGGKSNRRRWISRLQMLELRHFGNQLKLDRSTSLATFISLRKLKIVDSEFDPVWFSSLWSGAPHLKAVTMIDCILVPCTDLDSIGAKFTSPKGLERLMITSSQHGYGLPNILGGLGAYTNLQSLTVDVHNLQLISAAPSSLRELQVILRARSPRTAKSLLDEILTIRTTVAERVQSSAPFLCSIELWDYVSRDLEHAWIAAGFIITQSKRMALRNVNVKINLVRLPFNESDLRDLGASESALEKSTKLRSTLKSTADPIPRWLERQGLCGY